MNKRKQIIEIMPYDPNWPKQFEEEAAKLKQIFANNFVAIYHIGSTSVPNLAAKPTIDILLEVKNIEIVDNCNSDMEKLGYEAWGEYDISGRRFFVKGEKKRTHHVHTFQTGHKEIVRHLYFRDHLKSHPIEADEYAKLKIELASQFTNDRHAYAQNKQNYVKALEKKAMDWFLNQK